MYPFFGGQEFVSTKICYVRSFWKQYLLNRHFFGAKNLIKIFNTEFLLDNILSDQNFCGPKIFWTKICWKKNVGKNNFRTKNFSRLKIFLDQKFFDQNFFWTPNFFGLHIFFGPKIFLDQIFFWLQNCV